MSYTMTLRGRSSTLSLDIHPEITLPSDCEYGIALIGFSTFNSIPNIENGCNAFYISKSGGRRKKLTLSEGVYEVTDIEKYLQESIIGNSEIDPERRDDVLSIKPNNNTLKCMIKSAFDIDFRPKDSIGYLLGFSQKLLKAGVVHESDNPVDIVKVTTIRLECNIADGSFHENKASHTIYEFFPAVNPGYAINCEPSTPIFLRVNRKNINNITINVIDQRSKPVNFRNEEIVVRLLLRKL